MGCSFPFEFNFHSPQVTHGTKFSLKMCLFPACPAGWLCAHQHRDPQPSCHACHPAKTRIATCTVIDYFHATVILQNKQLQHHRGGSGGAKTGAAIWERVESDLQWATVQSAAPAQAPKDTSRETVPCSRHQHCASAPSALIPRRFSPITPQPALQAGEEHLWAADLKSALRFLGCF